MENPKENTTNYGNTENQLPELWKNPKTTIKNCENTENQQTFELGFPSFHFLKYSQME